MRTESRVQLGETMQTILLVDDEPMILTYCLRVLSDAGGFHVLPADRGRRAIDIASDYSGAIELLISDISMPGGITGIELASQLGPGRPEMKVLLMSGLVSLDFMRGGSWQFLGKPFRPDELLAKVRSMLPVQYRPMPLAWPFATRISSHDALARQK
ncbi:MAG TPA: response regulator [Candidatus Sulfopaludibacter sp.]|nr:response regulator [Candidatus Sulfopaludibacter sp.]